MRKLYKTVKVLTIFCFLLPFLPQKCSLSIDNDFVGFPPEIYYPIEDDSLSYMECLHIEVRDEIFNKYLSNTTRFNIEEVKADTITSNIGLSKSDSLIYARLQKHQYSSYDEDSDSTFIEKFKELVKGVFALILFCFFNNFMLHKSGYNLILSNFDFIALKLSFIALCIAILNEKFHFFKLKYTSRPLYILSLFCYSLVLIDYFSKLLYGYWVTLLLLSVLVFLSIKVDSRKSSLLNQ